VPIGRKAKAADPIATPDPESHMFLKDFTRTVAAHPVLAARNPRPETGLLAGTRIETETGWRDVCTLRIGDRVQTWDGGLVRIVALDRHPLNAGTRALKLAGGLLGTCDDLLLLPGQHLLVETLDDPSLPDALAVLVPASALRGRPGVTDLVLHCSEAVVPVFADEEAIWCQTGVLVHCAGLADAAGAPPGDGFFPRLSPVSARSFLDRRLSLAA